MKATTLLKNQHKEAKELLGKANKASSASERKKLAEQITHELEMHTTLEEEIFYPSVRDSDAKSAKKLVLEAREEHHLVDGVLEELSGLDPGDERFAAKLKVLKDLVEHHIEEEETEMFEHAKKLGDAKLEELGKQMQERAEQLKERA